MIRPYLRIASLTLLLLAPAAGAAQDTNFMLPVDSIEFLLGSADFELGSMRDTRFEGDRTQQVLLQFAGDANLLAQWAVAPGGGEAFNNQPRYEVAAYRLQRLFLEPGEYVVPPTALRVVPLDWYMRHDRRARPTFGDTRSVLVVLQYWLWNVTGTDFYDRDRLDTDTVYARHFGNFNIVTYLIRHSDANDGNYLVSQDSTNPRVFSVDNGVAFRSEESDRGYEWRRLRVDRLPAATIERLRAIDHAELTRALGVLAEYEIRDGLLVPVEPGANLASRRGVRRRGDRIQLGLTEYEINDVYQRMRRLLEDVDDGDIELF